MSIRAIAMRVVSFEPTSIFIVPLEIRLDEPFKAAYEEAVLMASCPSLVSSSGSEAVSPGPVSSSSSEPDSDATWAPRERSWWIEAEPVDRGSLF